jgi:hypothetical protein
LTNKHIKMNSPPPVMSLEDLFSSMRALDLGRSQDPEATPLQNGKVTVAGMKSRPRADSVHESSTASLKSQGKPEAQLSNFATAQKTERKSLLNSQSLNKKNGQPKYPKKGPQKTNSQTGSSALPAEKLEAKAQKAAPVAPATLHGSKRDQRQRHRKKGSNKAKTQPQLSALPLREQKPKVDEVPKNAPQQAFLYVVKASDRYETVIGVFKDPSFADESARAYIAQYCNSGVEIEDIVRGFGRDFSGTKPTPAAITRSNAVKASRRVWPNGTVDIRVYSHGLQWVKVLPKELPAATENTDLRTAYLALHRSSGLFVIGAYGSKDQAWEACRKYWTQLSYCMPIENENKWYDKQGMFHLIGIIGNTPHHWFVEPHAIDTIVDHSGQT